MDNYQIQVIGFVHIILSSITAGSVGESPPKKHRERSSIYVLWNDQRSHLCYALHRVRVCLFSFLFFTSAPCALLRFIEERDRCLESEKQAQAIERIVPRVYREKSFTRRLNVPILGSLFVDKESRFANSYSFTFHQGLTKGRGKQAKPGKECCNRSRLPNGCGGEYRQRFHFWFLFNG